MTVFNQADILRLAAVAWIDIGGVEAESLCVGMNRAVDACGNLLQFDVSQCEGAPASIVTPGSDNEDSWRQCLTTNDLRDDVPVRDVEQETLVGLSPSDGGYGFTIPRMME